VGCSSEPAGRPALSSRFAASGDSVSGAPNRADRSAVSFWFAKAPDFLCIDGDRPFRLIMITLSNYSVGDVHMLADLVQ
jgi:hypothetical protein